MDREPAKELRPGTPIVVMLEMHGRSGDGLVGEVVRQMRSGVRIRVEGIVRWENIEALWRASPDMIPAKRRSQKIARYLPIRVKVAE